MASKAQIAWRKKFGRMAKAGKFKKSKKSSSSSKKIEKIPATYGMRNLGSKQERPIVYPKNFAEFENKDDFAYVENMGGGNYSVVTYRKFSSPQVFVHKKMSKKEAINYATSFNFLNKSSQHNPKAQ